MPPISAVICTHVPEMLEAACRSVRWADEVVVIDSGADERTASIARAHADRRIEQPWLGYTGQTRFGMAQARHSWVLVLDRDEECSADLAEEIRALDDEVFERHAMFAIPRRHFVFGRVVRAWQPDRLGRLVHRDRTAWADELLHPRCTPLAGGRVGQLRGEILHRRTRARGFREFFDGADADARVPLSVRQLRTDGRICRWYHVALGPIAEFLKFYLLRLSILDGQFGVLIAYKAAFAEHLRTASLWAAQNGITVEETDPIAGAPAPASAPCRERRQTLNTSPR